jgi:hypothetical protein
MSDETDEATDSTAPLNEKEIGGVTYRTTPLAFSVGLPLLKRLIDIVAPVAAAALRGPTEAHMVANILETLPQLLTEKDLDRFANAFGPVSSYLNDAGQWVSLVKNAKVDNREIHFTGRYLEFMQWLLFCVEVNFKGFLGGVTKADSEKENEESPLKRLLAMVAPQAEVKSRGSDSGTTSNTA